MTAAELHDAALANHADALALYDLVFPPWRWLRWWKESRRIRARHRELVAAHRQILDKKG